MSNRLHARTRLLLLLPLLLAVSACGGGGSSSAASAAPSSAQTCTPSSSAPTPETVGGLTLLQIKPSSASSCITTADDPHQAYLPGAQVSKGKLAIFLPGTTGIPSQFPAFLQRGSQRGYHVIGLTYPNPESVTVLCNRSGGDAACAGDTREEVLSGLDTSKVIAIAKADSIEARIKAVLAYLTVHRANDQWGQFLNIDGSVVWSKVSVSGHSQGAGHAGYIGKTRAVYRVAMYSGASDWVDRAATGPAWFRLSSLTPNDAFFGFIHQRDTLANYTGNLAQVTDGWGDPAQFAMKGALVDVMNASPPFAGSQRLVTSSGCAPSGSNADDLTRHNCTMFRGNELVWDEVSFP
jgi:hypothetical protein